MKKIIEDEIFVRSDKNPGAVLNVDDFALKNYKTQRALAYEQRNKINKINKIEDDLNNLREEFSSLKDLIIKVLNK